MKKRESSRTKSEVNQMTVYADNAATTKMSPAAIETMTWAMENVYGNPSSLHTVGQKANEVLQNARATCARLPACVGDQTHSFSVMSPLFHAQVTASLPLADTLGA